VGGEIVMWLQVTFIAVGIPAMGVLFVLGWNTAMTYRR
jgi:hypothetical protein